MPVQPQITDPQAEVVLPLHKLDLETYNRIVESGALEGQRVELLDGVLVEMSPQSPAHAAVIERLTRHFAGGPLPLRVQSPLEVLPSSEPEPDLAVFAQRPGAHRHPRTAELVIEVAVSSQMIDRNVKAAMYAKAAVPVYWLVDVPAHAIEVRSKPTTDGYERCETFHEGAAVPSGIEGVADLDASMLFAGMK